MDALLAVILGVHAASTLMMTGLVWFVHGVHYPMFAGVARAGEAEWKRFEGEHLRRSGAVIIPLMLLELASASWLVLMPEGGVSRAFAWAGAGLLAVVWASTFLGAVPMHARLERGFYPDAHRWLMRFNLIRAVAWTGRSGLALLMLMAAPAVPMDGLA